jgi:Protein of unknown function (DUF3019)
MRTSASFALRWTALLGLTTLVATASGSARAIDSAPNRIHLELTPSVCTLSANDSACSLTVRARWFSAQSESLCLVVLEQPDIKRCWEHYEQGVYTLELQFSNDQTFQLRDPALQQVLASRALRVIREVLRYRHPRREPWNVFF